MALTSDALLDYFETKLRLDRTKLGSDTSLLQSGLIDSFAMVEVVTFIEASCRIKMKPSDVSLDNLDSIDRILAFIASRCGEGEASG